MIMTEDSLDYYRISSEEIKKLKNDGDKLYKHFNDKRNDLYEEKFKDHVKLIEDSKEDHLESQ